MPKSADLNKTWVPATSRGTTTFNAPGNLTVPYGRYKGTVSGKGGSGNAPTGSAWTTNYNTNYNIAYPIANRPIANQPIATWTTNYNVAYGYYEYVTGSAPLIGVTYTASWAGHDSGGSYDEVIGPWPCPSPWNFSQFNGYFSVTYSCVYLGQTPTYAAAYNVSYPVGNRPAATWTTNYNTNYNTAYPIANQPVANRPINAYTPGNIGTAINILGATFPGGPIDLSGFGGSPGTATPVGNTAVSYASYPDNTTYPVTVPPGGQVVVTIE